MGWESLLHIEKNTEMNFARAFTQLGFLLLLAMFPACQTSSSTQAQVHSPPPPELVDQSYLFEIVRHLYRWQLDESEIERIVPAKQIVFWAGRLETRLDPGDQSILGEILFPQLSLRVKVKKADYTIEESGTVVRSRTFRITQVLRGDLPRRPPRNYAVIHADMGEMRDYLFRTRNQKDFADPVLRDRLRAAVRAQAAREGNTNAPAGVEQVIHLAPLSPVANECWVFWESGRKLIHFASDIDLSNPAVWEQESLAARLFDVDQQVIVSREEAPGSNRFLTRYQVSRALYNCIVHGQRVIIPPLAPEPGTLRRLTARDFR